MTLSHRSQTNRRNFLGNLLVAGASFMVLPGAGRVWKAVVDQRSIPNPYYIPVVREFTYISSMGIGQWLFIIDQNEYPRHAGGTRTPILYRRHP